MKRAQPVLMLATGPSQSATWALANAHLVLRAIETTGRKQLWLFRILTQHS